MIHLNTKGFWFRLLHSVCSRRNSMHCIHEKTWNNGKSALVKSAMIKNKTIYLFIFLLYLINNSYKHFILIFCFLSPNMILIISQNNKFKN